MPREAADGRGREPYIAMLIADTRPRSRSGVTIWRSVVVLIVHMIGPTPIRKKLSPASAGVGIQSVDIMTRAAASPAMGPITITMQNGSARIAWPASSAPTTIPTP